MLTTGLMKVTEVAQVFRVSPATVRRMCAAGQLPGAVRFGGTWRIPSATVCTMLAPDRDTRRKDNPDD